MFKSYEVSHICRRISKSTRLTKTEWLQIFHLVQLSHNLVPFFLEDGCRRNGSICDVNAVCYNANGTYKCECKAGYAGNGTYCQGRHHHLIVCSWLLDFLHISRRVYKMIELVNCTLEVLYTFL